MSSTIKEMLSQETKRQPHQQDTDDKPRGLLDLPAELWIKIGKHAIDAHPFVHYAPWNVVSIAELEQPSITRTSVQLRSELLPYFYETRISLRLLLNEKRYRSKLDWVAQIGSANRRHLKHAQVAVKPELLEELLEGVRKVANLEVGSSVGDAKDWVDDHLRRLGDRGALVYPIIFK